MNQLTTRGFLLDQYITEESNEFVRFRIPCENRILIDEAELLRQFEDVRNIERGIWANGDQGITVLLKQYEPSCDGKIMHWR